MNSQAGFSIAEMVAAIFVLSLGAMAASETISALMNGWDRTETALDTNARMSAALNQIPAVQSDASDETNELRYLLAHERDLVLARPRIDRNASCRFDLVARQCR